MLRATKVRIYPSSEQRQILAFQFGAMRWVFIPLDPPTYSDDIRPLKPGYPPTL